MDDPVMPTVDLSALEGQELLNGLKNMGVDTRFLSQNKELLIVNALNPEPGITWAEPMLATMYAICVQDWRCCSASVGPNGLS